MFLKERGITLYTLGLHEYLVTMSLFVHFYTAIVHRPKSLNLNILGRCLLAVMN